MNEPVNSKSNVKFDGVIFDCDSTLSSIEGIDELAALAGVKEDVERLTNQAMNGEVALEDVYGKRLALIQPTREQLRQISECYLTNIVTGAKALIDHLQQHNVKVAIVSGGLYDAILPLATYLGVAKENVFAVHIAFDASNHYDHLLESPLATARGKYDVTQAWKEKHSLKQVALIGDGVSDVAALGAADVVIGYGGVVSREAVKQTATHFYEQRDLMGLLAFL